MHLGSLSPAARPTSDPVRGDIPLRSLLGLLRLLGTALLLLAVPVRSGGAVLSRFGVGFLFLGGGL